MTQFRDQDFIEFIVKSIVDHPEEVDIERNVDELGVLITLKVNKEDMGKIIGKDGKTAKAMRVLLRLIGSKNEERVNLKILEPEGSETPDSSEGSETSALPNAGLDDDLDL